MVVVQLRIVNLKKSPFQSVKEKMAKCCKFKTMLKTRCLKRGEGRGNELPPPIKIWQGKLGISAGSFFLTSSFKISKLIFELGGGVPFHVFNKRDSIKGVLRFILFRILEQLKFSAGEVKIILMLSILCRPS